MEVIATVKNILLSGTIPTEGESAEIVKKVLDKLSETDQTEQEH